MVHRALKRLGGRARGLVTSRKFREKARRAGVKLFGAGAKLAKFAFGATVIGRGLKVAALTAGAVAGAGALVKVGKKLFDRRTGLEVRKRRRQTVITKAERKAIRKFISKKKMFEKMAKKLGISKPSRRAPRVSHADLAKQHGGK